MSLKCKGGLVRLLAKAELKTEIPTQREMEEKKMSKEGLSRRAFLGSTVVAGAATCALDFSLAAGSNNDVAPSGVTNSCCPARIHVLYLAKPVPTWPKPDFKPEDDIKKIRPILANLEACKDLNVNFIGYELLRVLEHVTPIEPALAQADGLLIFNLTSGVSHLIEAVSAADLPVTVFSQPYSGHDWALGADWRAKGKLIDVVASSDFGELEPPLRILSARHRLRKSRLICIVPEPKPTRVSEALERKFGTPVRFMHYSRLNALYQAEDKALADEEAAKFTRGALKVVEPKPVEVADSFRIYHAIQKLMKEENANAITIDCLGGFKRGELPAYPCVAWSKLNDQGLHGVCEADLETAFTQMLFGYYSGKPGFVSDPVFDTKTNTVIHAHCVAATRMDGPQRPAAPYIVRSHMEDNKGVSMQVMMRVGETITLARLTGADTLLISTGRITATPDLPRGCRTKVTTKVKDAQKMLENYAGGLHRVLFYGDHLRAAHQMGRLLGLKVVEET